MKKVVTGSLIFQLVVLIISGMFLFANGSSVFADEIVKIGLSYPETGPYAAQGLDEKRGADMAADEINAAGGILGKKVQLVYRDTKSNPAVAKENAIELFDKEGVPMLFGGSSSGVAIADAKVALQKNKIFFGTLTYATATTIEEGNRNIFRECYDSYMAAKVLSHYLNEHFAGKKYFYITVDYIWGTTTEDAFRKFTNTTDKSVNGGVLTRLGSTDFKDALTAAKESGAQVLVLTEFGRDMVISVKQAYEMGLKKTMQIIVPNLTLDMAEGAGPEAMEGIIGAEPWNWTIPFKYNYPKGIAFVNKFEQLYKRYPSEAGGSAYVILHQYKDAVERAKTFDTKAVITALEGYHYTGLKDEQYWRPWDHQSIQTVYAEIAKPADEVKKSKYGEDYFEILNSMKGDEAAIDQKDWIDLRAKVGLPAALQEGK